MFGRVHGTVIKAVINKVGMLVALTALEENLHDSYTTNESDLRVGVLAGSYQVSI